MVAADNEVGRGERSLVDICEVELESDVWESSEQIWVGCGDT